MAEKKLNDFVLISVKEDGSTFACVVRMIHKSGDLVWVDVTAEKSQEAISNSFVCNYIAIE